jgi:hypothetical protein
MDRGRDGSKRKTQLRHSATGKDCQGEAEPQLRLRISLVPPSQGPPRLRRPSVRTG